LSSGAGENIHAEYDGKELNNITNKMERLTEGEIDPSVQGISIHEARSIPVDSDSVIGAY
jgi:hypothetical protein